MSHITAVVANLELALMFLLLQLVMNQNYRKYALPIIKNYWWNIYMNTYPNSNNIKCSSDHLYFILE